MNLSLEPISYNVTEALCSPESKSTCIEVKYASAETPELPDVQLNNGIHLSFSYGFLLFIITLIFLFSIKRW